MANISTAGGSITFFAPSPDDLVEFVLHHFINNDSSYYATDLYVPIGKPKETEDFTIITHTYEHLEQVTNEDIEYLDLDKTLKYKITYEFNGSGRWSFDSNIEWFFPQIMNTNHHLAEKPFAALFDYFDIEGGADFALKAETYVKWMPEEKDADIINICCEEHNYDKKGLIAVGAYDGDEIFDTEEIKKDPSIIYDELDKDDFILKHKNEFEQMLENNEVPYLIDGDMEYIIHELEYYLRDFISSNVFRLGDTAL